MVRNIKIKYANKILKIQVDQKTRVSDIQSIIEKEFPFRKNSYHLQYENKILQEKENLYELIKEEIPIEIIYKNEVDKKKNEASSPFNFLEKEMGKNSELRQIIQSENFMEEMGKMSNDTNYYNQQAKNADIAMSRLETLPGGINLMNSMVNDISNPLNKFMDSNKNVKDLKGENISNPLTDPIPSVMNGQQVNYLLLYRKELSQLKRIGFNDLRRNLEALKRCQGDLVETVEILTQEDGRNMREEF